MEINNIVSVIVPVYNVEAYLERCLRSIVNQTYEELEIIIINDGSTDNSKEICRKWEKLDKRIILLETKNRGLGPARNLGITKATGEYIAFIDSDDWWERNTIEEMMRVAIDNAADIVYMNFFFSEWDEKLDMITEREFVQYYLFDGISSVEENSELLFQPDMRMWSKIFRKKLFTDNDIWMPAHPYEDFPVMPLLLLKAERICQVHKPLYHYFYKRNGNLTGNMENHKYIAWGLEELYKKIEEWGYLKKYGKELSEYIFTMAKGTIDDVFKNYIDKNQYRIFAEPFWNIMEKYCQNKIELRTKKAYLLGSRSGELICKSFLFEEQVIGKSDLLGDEISDNDITKMIDADYIFLDFLTEEFKDFPLEYNKKIDIIYRYGLIGKVILLKLFYVSEYGIHKDRCKTFNNVDDINKMNRNLQTNYTKFENHTNKKVKMVIEFNEIRNYTYEHTKAGCYPWYYHGNFHIKAADKIRLQLKQG